MKRNRPFAQAVWPWYWISGIFMTDRIICRSEDRSVRRLFHQLNGAKEELLLVVKQNEPLYAVLLDLL